MPSALTPAEPAPSAARAMLTDLINLAGGRIAYAPLAEDAHWDSATQTLTVRSTATPAEQAVALSEFFNCVRFGEQHSRFTPTAQRHLYAIPPL